MNTTEPSSTSSPRKRGIDAEALLASLAPVVAKPDDAPSRSSMPPKSAEPTKIATKKKSAEPASKDSKVVKKQTPSPAEPAREDDEVVEQVAEAKPARKVKKQEASSRQRATLDVEINPGEGTTAIYVRVPRTTHLALKIQALENQAAMEGPTELASIVRTAIGEYLERQAKKKAA